MTFQIWAFSVKLKPWKMKTVLATLSHCFNSVISQCKLDFFQSLHYKQWDPQPALCRQVSPRPSRAPGGFPVTLATPGSITGTDHPPTASRISTCAAQVYPTLAALQARFQPQWPSPRAQLGSPPLPPPGADTRPAPPGLAPPLPRSRGAAHLHQWLSVSPVPTPGSRRGSRTSLLPPGQT